MWWYLLGGFVLAVLILALAVRSLLGRLAALHRAGLRLQQRAGDAQALQGKAEALRERLEGLAARAEEVQEHVAARAAR